MLFADDIGRERFRGRGQRIDCRINEPSYGIERSSTIVESRCAKVFAGSRIGQIVRRHIDRLHRSNGAFVRRGDAFLRSPISAASVG
jgi:hypothetical protein